MNCAIVRSPKFIHRTDKEMEALIFSKDVHETGLAVPVGPLPHRVSIVGKNPLIKPDNGGTADGIGALADGVVTAVVSVAEFEGATGIADGSGAVPPLSIFDNEST